MTTASTSTPNTMTLPFGYDGAAFTLEVHRTFSEHGENFVEGRVLAISDVPEGEITLGMVGVWTVDDTGSDHEQ